MDVSNGQFLSEKCSIDQCQRKTKSLCKCCKQELCYKHLWEHDDLLLIQLNLLKKDINEVEQRLQTVNIRELMCNFRENLKQWRVNCYTAIDNLYDKKCKEYYEYLDANVNKQHENFDTLQQRIEELANNEEGSQQEIGFIKSTVDDLNKKIDKIQQSDFQVTLSPLIIDENLIQIN